ncbi:MAG: hypothetical protein RLZZ450_1264 [Pseudomonadota bacterium]
MKRTHAWMFCLTLLACADEGDDTMQVAENASTPPLSFESNTLLEVLALDSSSCTDDAKRPQAGFEVYQDASTFRAAYLTARPGASTVPTVDFQRYVVVGAFLGLQASCSVDVSIVSATNKEERVEVDVKIARPEGCTGAAATSFPFTFARLNRIDKPYVSIERTEAKPCP